MEGEQRELLEYCTTDQGFFLLSMFLLILNAIALMFLHSYNPIDQ